MIWACLIKAMHGCHTSSPARLQDMIWPNVHVSTCATMYHSLKPKICHYQYLFNVLSIQVLKQRIKNWKEKICLKIYLVFDLMLITCMLLATICVCLNKVKVQFTPHKGQDTIEISKKEIKFCKVIAKCLRPFSDEELLDQFSKWR